MKHAGLMQLTVEVGKCTLPPLPYNEYSLSVHLSNHQTMKASSFRHQLPSSTLVIDSWILGLDFF
jgi:hypothetical protein